MRIFCQCMIIWSIGALCAVWAADPLTLCYENKPNPPFYYGSANSPDQPPGVAVDVIREAARLSDAEVVFMRMPWKRCILSLQRGQVDGAFELSFKPERAEKGRYPMQDGKLDEERYLHELAYHLYTLDDSGVTWNGEAIEHLNGPIAAVSGYSIVNDLSQDGYPVVEGLNQRSNLEMLLRGRVKGLAQIERMTASVIAEDPERYLRIQKHPLPLRMKKYYLVFSHQFYQQHNQLAEKIWNQLRSIRQTGQYNEIISLYQ